MRASISLLLGAYLLTIASPAFAQTTPIAAEEYLNSIDYVQERGMLVPFADGLFHPELPVTRVDIIKSVVRDVYSYDVRNDCFDRIAPRNPYRFTHLFTDVSVTNAAAQEICVGMLVGIVEGNPDGSFGTQQSANLVQAAKIVTKAYGIAPKPSLRVQSGIPWHEPYWFALARRNAIPDTVKSRDAVLTRGEYAEILYRLRDERPTQGFHYRPTMVKEVAQSSQVDVAESVLMSTAPLPQSAPASLMSTTVDSMSPGLLLQLHVEERRQMRLSQHNSLWIGQASMHY